MIETKKKHLILYQYASFQRRIQRAKESKAFQTSKNRAAGIRSASIAEGMKFKRDAQACSAEWFARNPN